MKRAFSKKSRGRLPRWVYVAAGIGLLIAMYEFYSILVPFQANNPLWKQVTVGQPVIDNWTYGGQDEEGYLRFFHEGESVILPPTAKLFSADGQFVVIEGYSPSSLTYAPPLEAIPLPWLFALVAVTGVGGWLFLVRRKQFSFLRKNSGRSAGFGKSRRPSVKRPSAHSRFIARNSRFRSRARRNRIFKR